MIPETTTKRSKPTLAPQFWNLVVMIVAAVCVTGGVFGWILFARGGNQYNSQFDALRAADLRVDADIKAETVARQAADMILMPQQANLSAAIDQEIVTRTTEDIYLLQLITIEIAERIAAQNQLNATLQEEIENRTISRDYYFWLMANLTARMQIISAFDAYAAQQFMIKMANLTNLKDALAAETAARIAADNFFAAQDAMQLNEIAQFTVLLAQEIAARQAEDMYQMGIINGLLTTGLYTINDVGALNNNIDIVSPNPIYVIGNGGTNVITIKYNGVMSLGGATGDPANYNVDFVPGNNVFVTPDIPGHSLTIGLVDIAIPPNRQYYSGFVTPISPAVFPFNNAPTQDPWYLDLSWQNDFITNYGTVNQVNPGLAWEIPTSGGVGYGIWSVTVTVTVSVYVQQVNTARQWGFGLCYGQLASCISCPTCAEPQSATSLWVPACTCVGCIEYFDSANPGYLDATTSMTMLLDGRGVPPGTGVYIMWRQLITPSSDSLNIIEILSVMKEYDITQLQ